MAIPSGSGSNHAQAHAPDKPRRSNRAKTDEQVQG
jgi:hypothetical protein